MLKFIQKKNPVIADEIEKVIRDQAIAIRKELEGNPKPEEKISDKEKNKEEDKQPFKINTRDFTFPRISFLTTSNCLN